MKKILKNIFFFVIPVFFIIFFIFSYNVIKTDFRFAHQSSMVYNFSFDWPKYFIFGEVKQFVNKFQKDKNLKNFKKINFYINEQNSRSLLEKTPLSTKKWVKAKVEYDGNNLRDIRLRYRGDNPRNWLMLKKSFKIRTKRKEQIDGVRNFDYFLYSGRIFMPFFISKKMNLINQKANIVDIFFNGEPKGLFVEVDRIDENFLRNNNLMPVNIYKGENWNVEKHIGVNDNLFNNANLWSKLAIFNQKKDNDKSDLEKFLKALNKKKYYNENLIQDYIDMDYFSKFEAFLTLTQNSHHDWSHNLRFVLDPWSGKIIQLITDPNISNSIHEYPFLIDFAANDLSSYLNLRTDFIHNKYKWLYHYIKKQDVITELEKYFNLIKKDLSLAEKKEPFSFDLNHTADFQKRLNFLKSNKKNISEILESNFQNSYWKKGDNGLEIVVSGHNSLSNLKFTFDNENAPEWVGLDINYDKKISETEPKFFLKKNKNSQTINVPIVIYANRIKKSNSQSKTDQDYKLYSVDTKFSFITENDKKPINISSENFFTKKNYNLISKKTNNAVKTNNSNKIIFIKQRTKSTKILSGNIIVKEDLVFNNPVKIEKGTVFSIMPNKHVIFKNKVVARGDKENPIIFKKLNSAGFNNSEIKPWGSIVLIGGNTKNSIFDHVKIRGGSGGWYKQFYFTSMFSLHNADDIKIINSEFSSNEIFDDTIHIVYCKNIILKNIEILNAYADAIDIDISKNIYIENANIVSPINDGIDFMQSAGELNNVSVSYSKDKALSIGENSSVVIKNSKFSSNNIGVAIKDKSKAKIYNTSFKDNDIQVAGYAKNWRYSGGGNIEIYKSFFSSSKTNQFITTRDPDENEETIRKDLIQDSSISIFNSKLDGKTSSKGLNILIN
tara:strand:+ start:193 stop:2868 length:2676 start_codon:yes stop_codon:yes gene_type:complete